MTALRFGTSLPSESRVAEASGGLKRVAAMGEERAVVMLQIQVLGQATLTTSLPRTWPASLIRCASARSARANRPATGMVKRPWP